MVAKYIKKLLSHFGFSVYRIVDFEKYSGLNKELSFSSIQYISGIRPTLVEMPLEIGRTNRWFDLSEQSIDPMILAVRRGLNLKLVSSDLYQIIQKTLHDFRSTVSFANAAEKMGLVNTASGILEDYPAWSFVYPWDIESISKRRASFPYAVKRDRSKHGVSIKSDDPDEIMKIDAELSADSHALQYAALTERILSEGFKSNARNGFVQAEILVYKGNVRWKPSGDGNHRVVIAAALGIKAIPVLVTKVVNVDEVSNWPGVLFGIYTASEAKEVFHNIFNACPPSSYDSWIKKN